jgi:hypothetical protein
MSAVVENLLRLARHADVSGRPAMRDAVLTLAVAEGGADNVVLAERCRRLLIKHRPDHWFAASVTLGHALTRPKVAQALEKLRLMYPPARVSHMLLRAEAARGPYAGWKLPIARVLEDLTPAKVATPAIANGRAKPRTANPAPALTFPGGDRDLAVDPDGKMALFYLSVLLAIAILLNSVLRPTSSDTKAA